MSDRPYPSGKWSDALFLYKVGQRVYHVSTCEPCIVTARYRNGEYSRYRVVFMDGYKIDCVQRMLTDIKPHVWNPEASPQDEAPDDPPQEI